MEVARGAVVCYDLFNTKSRWWQVWENIALIGAVKGRGQEGREVRI